MHQSHAGSVQGRHRTPKWLLSRHFDVQRSLYFGLATCLLGILLVACEPVPDGSLSVRVAPATERVTRDGWDARWTDAIELHAARGEVEPFQVVLRASGGPIRQVEVDVSDLEHEPSGGRLSAASIALFREYFLNVLQTSGGFPWLPRMEYPGPMLPFQDPYDPAHPSYGAPFPISRIGSVGTPYVAGSTDSGFVFPAGSYTGRGHRRYVIQVEPPGPAGQATFRWSDSWRSGFGPDVKVWRWNQRGLPVPPLGPDRRSETVPLNHGISIWFCAGKEPRFERGRTFHFNAYCAMNEVVWGEISVPREAAPGVYRGRVRIRAEGQPHTELPLSLTVWDFEVPRERSITTAFNGWMDPSFYSRCPGAERHFELLQHAHRLDTQTVPEQSVNWVWQYPDLDWSSFDAAAAPRLEGSCYPYGAPLRRFHLGMYTCGGEWHWANAARKDPERVKGYGRLFAAHLKERGWFERVYMYCRDEPGPEHLPGILRDIRAFQEGDPEWKGKFMVTSRPTADSPLLDWIDIWCVKFHWPVEPRVLDAIRRRGGRLWCYAANAPYAPNPTYHLDSLQGYEPRIIKWASWRRGAEGFLYWATVLDQTYPNPWTTPMNDFGACGDANLMYYGARDGPALGDNATPLRPIMGPLADFRLKQIREGLEDWEYLILAERLKGRAFVDALASEVYRDAGGPYGQFTPPGELDGSWTQDPWKIYEVRKRLAAAILEELAISRP